MLGEGVCPWRCKTGLYLSEASCLVGEVGQEWQRNIIIITFFITQVSTLRHQGNPGNTAP